MLAVSFMAASIPLVLAAAFAAAYWHIRLPSRRRSGGGLARLVLAGGACLLLLYSLYELSVQREFKPENVPIRVDMLFIGPALVGLLVLGLVAYVYGISTPKVASAAGAAPAAPPKMVPGPSGTVTIEQANGRLAHLLQKETNGQ